MKIEEIGIWRFYQSELIPKGKELTCDKAGKWMYFSKDVNFAAKLCSKAIDDGIVVLAKHSIKSRDKRFVCCFYLNGDSVEGHIKTIQFFLDNNLIAKTKDGRLYNISFKLNIQTMQERLGLIKAYTPILRLDYFIDLDTGEWKG